MDKYGWPAAEAVMHEVHSPAVRDQVKVHNFYHTNCNIKLTYADRPSCF